MSHSLFISDLHLDPARTEGIQLFEDFIRNKAADADQLYILGDLFEYWLGDDACQHSGYQTVVDNLAWLKGKGTTVYFMHGNRDFLIADQFTNAISGELLPDPSKIELQNIDALLMHGDSLCTDDAAHQQFRALTRDHEWQASVLAKSIEERAEIARQMRMNSQKGNAEKSDEIMDVTQSTVMAVMQEHNVRLLIHGHTHRTAIHEFELAGQPCHRIVLGDWYKEGNYLLQENNKFSLFSYPNEEIVATVVLAEDTTLT